MPTSFTVKTGSSVPSNYTWDSGSPFSSISPLVSVVVPVNGGTVSGYAPGVKIQIQNDSSLTTQTDTFTALSSLYIWDFGDFYNHKNNNYTLTCSTDIEHVYIMPGTYTVVLTRLETSNNYDPQFKQYYLADRLPDPPFVQEVCVVEEIPPVAGFYAITTPTGTAPHSIRFTARTTTPGSFPIDKIVWDFGDGSPLLTVSRYATAGEFFNVFNQDPADPRNYEPIHTYQRSYNDFDVFYPSITAYSSSTDTADSCSITVGPIYLPSLNEINILRNKLTPYGSFYAFEVNNNDNIIFAKSLTNILSSVSPSPKISTINTPQNPIRNTTNQPVIYSGNIGNNYYTENITC